MANFVIEPMRSRHSVQLREPAIGVASRLAALNGQTMPELLRSVTISPYNLDKGSEQAIRGVATLAGSDPAPLLRYSHRHTVREHFIAIAGETFGYKRVHRTIVNFCPLCVAEDLEVFAGPTSSRPWLRLDWMIDHMRNCDRHGAELVATTPLRGRYEPFDFSQEMRRHIPQLSKLTKAQSDYRPSEFQAWLRRRLDSGRNPGFWLDQFPMYVAAPWCEALGVSALHPPKIAVSALTRRDWAEAAEEGFRISTEGVDGVEKLLERLNTKQQDTRGVLGLRDTYGYLYQMLQNWVKEPAFEPLRELVRSFADRTIPIAPGADVLGKIIAEPQTLSIRSAARQSGVHDRSIRRFFEREGLASDALEAGRRNHRVTASRAELGTIVSDLRDAMTAPQVIKALNIPRPHLQALLGIGALPTITGSEKQAHAKHRFAPRQVEAMLDRMLQGAEAVKVPGPRQMPIVEARHAAVTSIEVLLNLIFDGKLRWKGRLVDKEGMDRYNALLVDVDEVTACVRAEAPMKHLLRQEVPDIILGMSTLSIDFFVAAGLLDQSEEFSPEARRMVPVITKESSDSFRAKFVTLGELRQQTNLHVKQIKLILKGNKIEPCYEPGPAKGDPKVYVYDRASIDAVAILDADLWVYDKTKAQSAARR